MKDEKLITTRRVKLSDVIYYFRLLNYIPVEWHLFATLKKTTEFLTILELKRILMYRKYARNISLLNNVGLEMQNKKIDSMMIDIDLYNEMMDFDLDEIIEMKFQDERSYKDFLFENKIKEPNHSVLNDGVNIYDNKINSSGVNAKTHIKRHFKRGIRY